ncbi:hypothetical protein GJU40_15905 [Bacillus lacus]|uniref:UPF0738 protein GJU40_15905 n=1 Tax=Metabacillus lacus TaxID=1983721 RepID=A0A7X2M024_9BACI|nr:hypothetical protein [Metabacillus lacus]MRX73628.1 hypothetical protein [Metabacillus lacus]
MKTRFEIGRAEITEDKVRLHAEGLEADVKELSPKGQMLADSDNLSFVYILENQNSDFVYAGLPSNIWGELRTGLEKSIPFYLALGEREIELLSLHEELSYLIENIKDNANYGEKMEEKVQELFYT